ncbi:tyrosine 3-monooxygenase-like [Tetranychus urticae]|uniref:tyrosine 3-monooxygenase-like n=1 Tax=Tetranychus urticae TaxID=32264 RepID=UPI00077BC289|nr:tyrosine 3-monooxygenase-like [Tetranychus urticae]
MASIAALSRAKFSIKSYSVEHGYPSRRRSLVDDAKFETQKNREARLSWLQEQRQNSQDTDLPEEEVLVVSETNNDQEFNKPQIQHLLLRPNDGTFSSLPRILKFIETCKGHIEHIESRCNRDDPNIMEIFLRLEISSSGLLHLMKSLRHGNLAQAEVLKEQLISIKDPWFPRHISDLDFCTHIMTKYEPDLDIDHPGFTDKVYRARRKEIAQIAFDYRWGQRIPDVEYTPDEIKTWGAVYRKLVELYPTHACRQHVEVFQTLERECGYSPDSIPQLEAVSNFLRRRTGFTLRPAAGLLTARDFLASLAFRVFQSTQYIRHGSNPDHSPEPDCIHELLGHAPILADPTFAEFSQEIGLASLGADDQEIERFATLYWFTVEFGLCMEDGRIKAYGAGLLSSYGELQHSLSDKPEKKPFEPEKAAVQPYQDVDYQGLYFVAQSFEKAKEQLKNYVYTKLKRRFDVAYDPFTQSIEVINNLDKLKCISKSLESQLSRFNGALNRLSLAKK